MRKLICALVLVVVACFAVAATAGATPGPIQVSGQSAGTSQQAVAGSSATQTDPSNTNIAIRVLSPGNDGAVTQSNTAASTATAGNASTTGQSSSQTAGGSGIQTSQQSAGTDQLAIALSAANQVDPSNVNVPIRVLSPGSDGNVTQSNTAASTGTAGNTSTTGQSGSQTSGSSCGCEGSAAAPIQTSDQSAGTHQSAGALSKADQIDPKNTNVSVRVLSPGDGGSVAQSNTAASTANAGNAASTSQQGAQTAGGSSCGCGGSPVQQAKQTAGTAQDSAALSAAAQIHPSNVNAPVRVLSPGNDGSVDQSNTVASTANAGNTAGTTQGASQTGAGGSGVQIAGQDAKTAQGSLAGSGAFQAGASNNASPVRVSSPGNGGDVKQSNTAASTAQAGNAAGTTQNGTQTNAGESCGCGGAGIQVLGQQSATEQAALGLSAAVQDFGERSRCGCGGSGAGNTASPVRVYSPGDDGSVDQSNTAASVANAGNTAGTRQDGSQTEAGGGLQIQALGQKALTGQFGLAGSLAAQFAPSNAASPVRVYSDGGGGSVKQANTAASQASGANNAGTSQGGRQTIGGASCGCGASLPIQAAGQQAETGQSVPAALSQALQALPSNGASPQSVWSAGDAGWLGQSNTGASVGDARNRSESGQGVGQTA
jgi:hypothetical protein